MYYKIPKTADLSATSYRAKIAHENGYIIEYNSGAVGLDWVKISEEELVNAFGKNPFYEEPQEEVPEPTEQELIQAELLLNQMDIMAKQAEHDEVLAEILLNQLEV